MEVGFEECLDILMLCACCLSICILKRKHTRTYTDVYTHTHIDDESGTPKK